MKVAKMEMSRKKTHGEKHFETKEKWDRLAEDECLLFDNKREAQLAYATLQNHCNKMPVHSREFTPAFRTLDGGQFGIWRQKLSEDRKNRLIENYNYARGIQG